MFGLFKKRKKEKAIEEKLSDKIVFEQLEDARDSLITRLATELINGSPLIINLSLLDIDDSNKVTTFLLGVIYTIEGNYYEIDDKTLLLGDSKLYEDGSIKSLLESLEN